MKYICQNIYEHVLITDVSVTPAIRSCISLVATPRVTRPDNSPPTPDQSEWSPIFIYLFSVTTAHSFHGINTC